MEKTSNAKKRKSGDKTGQTIKEAYILHVLTHGQPPASVFVFAKELKLKETDFYLHFSSFGAVENSIWIGMFEETLKRLNDDEVYHGYSARERLLAFYYTWVEALRGNRSFITYCLQKSKKVEIVPSFMKAVKAAFIEYVDGLLADAIQNEEVLDRPVLSKRYADGIWIQFLFVLNFWVKDNSKGFEATDVAIEKAVNLSFDMMGRGPLDAMVDFAKFLYQNR